MLFSKSSITRLARISANYFMSCIVCLCAFNTPSTLAGSPGEEFNNLITSICVGFPPPELIPLCLEFSGDGGSGGAGGGVGGSNNLGVVGAQNQTANISAAQLQESIKERIDEGNNPGIDLGLFVTARSGNIERRQTFLENGYDADENSMLIGVDHRYTDKLVIGAAFNRDKNDTTFDAGAGTLDTESTAVTLFTSYTVGNYVSIDAYIGYASIEYDNVRNIFNTTIPKQTASNTDATQTLGGINIFFSKPDGSWLYGFEFKLDYINTEIDAYTEFSTLGNTDYRLSYPDQTLKSLTNSFGFNVSYNYSQSWGVLVPNFQLLYVHESENESRDIITRLAVSPSSFFITTTDEPDMDYWVSNIGASAVLPNDIQLFAELKNLHSHEYLNSWSVSTGIRMQF